MALFRKKIERIGAIQMFVESIIVDAQSSWPEAKHCLNSNELSINNEDEAYALWFTGLLAVNTLQAYQVYNAAIAKSITNSVGYYFDFRIKELKDWPQTLRTMYDYFCYITHKEMADKGLDALDPPLPTAMHMLAIMHSGFGNNSALSSLPAKSPETLNLVLNFTHILARSIGRWAEINKNYKVKWS